MTEIFSETQHENQYHWHDEESQMILDKLRTYLAAGDGIPSDICSAIPGEIDSVTQCL
jgi:hypothetical protein